MEINIFLSIAVDTIMIYAEYCAIHLALNLGIRKRLHEVSLFASALKFNPKHYIDWYVYFPKRSEWLWATGGKSFYKFPY